MAKKMTAVFLMWVVVVAALQFSAANKVADVEAKFKPFLDDVAQLEAKFKSCYEPCEKKCMAKGNVYLECNSKCDTYCGKMDVADKRH